MPLEIKLTGTPRSYVERLDGATQERIRGKLAAIANDPYNFALSKPLTNTEKRSARVGGYRILFALTKTELIVADIGPRGQVYRKMSRKAAK